MIYVDRTGFTPDDAWLTRADELTRELLEAETLEQKHKIIDDHENLWGELKDVCN